MPCSEVWTLRGRGAGKRWGAEGVSLLSPSLLTHQGRLRTSYRSIFLGARHGVAVEREGEGTWWKGVTGADGSYKNDLVYCTPSTSGWVGLEVEQDGCWVSQGDSLAPTWIIAGDSRGTAEDLPQQCRVLPAVLDEDILQGLCPVKFIEDDSSWGAGQKAEVGSSRLNPAKPISMTPSMASLAQTLIFQDLTWGHTSSPKKIFLALPPPNHQRNLSAYPSTRPQ